MIVEGLDNFINSVLKPKMTILILFFGVFFVSSVWAEDCIKTNVVIETSDTVDDIDTVLYEEEFLDKDNPVTKYSCNPIKNDITFAINVENEKISIKKGPNFNKFDDYSDIDSNRFQIICSATCKNTASASASIILTVKDINQNDPEWNEPNPVITIPMPLPKKLDILLVGNVPLKTTDKDFTNTEVTYKLSPEVDNLFTATSSKNGKDYTLGLTTKEKLSLINDLSFTITATDNGETPRSKVATVTLKIDEDDSIRNKPSFAKSSYSYNFDNGKIQPQDGDGKIVIETDQKTVDISVEPEGAIECIRNSDTTSYTLECSYIGTDALAKTTLYTLSAKTQDTSTTTIIVFVASTGNGPQFEQSHYTATYNKNDNTLTLDNPIKTKETADSIVLVGDEYSGVLEFTKNKDEEWEITVKDGSKFTKNPALIDLAAKLGDLQGTTSTLVINVPEKTLSITNSFYEGSYSLTDKLKVENPKLEGDDLENVDCSMVEANLADYIQVSYDKDAKECQIKLKKDFNDEILAKTEVVFTVKASLTTDPTIFDSCTIVVSLPQQSSVLPKFGKPYYVGKYENNNPDDTLTVDGSITVTSDSVPTVSLSWDISDVKIDEYLTVDINKDTKEVAVKLVKNFPDSLKTNQDVVVTILAEIDKSNIGKGVLVINLPVSDTTNVPKFGKPYYVGKYENNNPDDSLTVDGPITVTADSVPSVSLAWDISDVKIEEYLNVEINKDTKEVTVKLVQNFPDSLKTNQDVVVTISAEIDKSNIGKGVLVINLPTIESSGPKFENPNYVGSYDASTKELTIDDLKVESENLEKLSLSIKYDNIAQDEYLDVNIDTKTGVVTLTTTSKELPTDEEHIIATISATDENKLIGSATLLIFVHKVNPTDPPEFLSSHYEATYNQNDKTVILTQKIAFKSTQPDSILLSDEDAKYFTIEKVDDEWKVSVKSDEPITDEMLHKDNVIVQMTAEGGNGVQSKATLIVLLPGLTAQFNERSYSAVYTSDDKFSVDSQITIENYLSTVKAKLVSADYQIYFEISSKDNVVTLNKKDDLSEDIKKESFITLTIALEDSDVNTDTAVVNVKLPGDGDTSDTPKFEKPYYVGKYENNNPDDTLTVDGPITVTSDSVPSVSLAWDISDVKIDDYLKVEINKDTKEVTVKLDQNFPDSLKTSQDVVVTILAEIDKSNIGKGVLVINLPVSDTTNVPKFGKPYYVGKYVNNNPDDTLTVDDLITVTSDSVPTVSLSWDISDVKIDEYLNVEINKDTKEVTVKLVQNFPDSLKTNQDVVVTILAEIDKSNIGKGVLVINLPTIESSGPKFENPNYVGTYDAPNKKLTINDLKVESENLDKLSFSIKYDKIPQDDYLEVNIDTKTGVVTLTTTSKELPTDDDYIIATISATDENKLIGSATLLIFVHKVNPTDPPEFLSSHYEAIYNQNDKTVTLTQKIMFKNTQPDSILLSEEDAKYFTMEKVDDEWKVSVKSDEPITDEMLHKDSVIVQMTAEGGNGVQSKATLIVLLPGLTAQFNERSYSAVYTSDDKFSVDSKITIENYLSTVKPKLVSPDYQTYFEISSKDNVVTLNKKVDLSEDIKKESFITLTIALEDSDVNTDTAVVNVKLPGDGDTSDTPKFEKPYYVGKYENNNPDDSLTVDGPITVTSDSVPTVSLSWDISDVKIDDYLRVEINKDTKEVSVKLVKNFPDSLKTSQDVVVTILAEIDKSNIGKGVLVINLPTSDTTNVPKFGKPYYVGKYENNNPDDTLNVDGSITVTANSVPSVSLAWDISDVKIDDYLKVEINKDTKEVTVKLVKNFPDSLKTSQDVVVTISAEIDKSNIGKGVLVINLPTIESSGPKFENPNYVGTYDAPNKKLTINDLKVESENLDKLSFSIKYDKIPQDDYLDVNIDTKTGIVKLTTTSKELPTEEDHIIATISATDENKLIGSATLLIFVTKENPTDPPEFLSSHYEATYNQNDKTVTLIQKIMFKNAQPDSIKLSEEDAKYFTMEKVDDEWKVSVKSDEPITDEMLHKDSVIVQMTAEGGNAVQSKATLIVLLPGLTSQFNERSYSAVYTSDDKFSVDSKITIENYLSTVKPKLVSSDYQTYFEISSKDDEVILTNSQRLTDEIKLKSFITLTIALEDGDETTDSSVVNIKLPGGGGDDDDDDDKDELDKKNKTIKGYIAAVSVLSVLLAAVIGGFAALYLLKFRRTKNYNTMEEEYTVKQSSPETKTAEKYDTPIGSVSQRRATGFVFNPPPPEDDEEDEEKTVKFNENVEQIKIEKSQDGSDNEEEEKPEKTEETKEEDSKEPKTNDDDLL